MNIHSLAAALLLCALPAGAALAAPVPAPVDDIPTLPTVEVRPDPAQRAELLARKVVDLAAVQVRPDAVTQLQAAGLLPEHLDSWVSMPTLPLVRAGVAPAVLLPLGY